MSLLGAMTLIGIVIVAVLLVFYFRKHATDQINEIVKKRGANAKIAEPARFVEGMEEIPVALMLTDSSILYENHDMQARIDLDQVDEIQYDDELSTAKEVKDGRVLRLRSHGQTFEFIVDRRSAALWSDKLPGQHVESPASASS